MVQYIDNVIFRCIFAGQIKINEYEKLDLCNCFGGIDTCLM